MSRKTERPSIQLLPFSFLFQLSFVMLIFLSLSLSLAVFCFTSLTVIFTSIPYAMKIEGPQQFQRSFLFCNVKAFVWMLSSPCRQQGSPYRGAATRSASTLVRGVQWISLQDSVHSKKMKLAFPQRFQSFRPIRLLKDIAIRYHWLKMAKPRLFVADHLCRRKAVFTEFVPIRL